MRSALVRTVASTPGPPTRWDTASRRQARLFVLDARSGKRLADIVPVPGASAITAVTPLDEHRILGAADTGHLFHYDVGSGRSAVVTRLPHVRDLRWWARVKGILGIAWRRGLFRLDPKTLQVSWLLGGPDKLLPGIAFDGEGRAYVHDGTRIYRVTAR